MKTEHYFIRLIFFFLLLSSSRIYAQPKAHLVQPTLFDFFMGSQIIGDSIIRLVGRASDAPNPYEGRAFYVDYNIHDIRKSPAFHWIVFDSAVFNFAVSNMFFLPTDNGNAVIVFEHLDCDHSTEPLIVGMDGKGDILWAYNIQTTNNSNILTNVDRVGKDVIRIVTVTDSLYFNFNGQSVEPNSPLIQYQYVRSFQGGYFAKGFARDYILDVNGNILFEWVGKDFLTFNYFLNNSIVTTTIDSIFLWNSSQQLLNKKKLTHRISRVVCSDSLIFIFDHIAHQFYIYDTSLSLILQRSNPKETLITGGVVINDTMYAWGFYHQYFPAGTPRGMFVYQDRVNNFTLKFSSDISLDAIQLADTVKYEISPWSVDKQGIDVLYEPLRVVVSNQGMDTITEFKINFFEYSGCEQCTWVHHEWIVDSVVLAPLESKWIDLGNLNLQCARIDLSELCLWVSLPNQSPDRNQDNDAFCQPVNFVTRVPILQSRKPIKIYPNPASNSITISGDKYILDDGPYTLTIHNLDDRMIIQTKQFNGQNEFDISNLSIGIYMVFLKDKFGTTTVDKLAIVR